MSSTCSSMYTTQQVEDPSSSRRESTSLNLLKTEKTMIQKIDLINTRLELLFLAVARIEHDIMWTYIAEKDGSQFPLSILANSSDYFTLTGVSDIHSEAQFSVNNRDQWAELGIATEYFYHDQYPNGQNDNKAPMMMSGLPIDYQSRHWGLIYSQMQTFPKALIDQAQDIIMMVMDKYILGADIPPHIKGQMWAVERLQRIKVQLQNQIFRSRNIICAMLKKAMDAPVTSLSETVTAEIAILTSVSLRERAWSLYCGEGETDLVIEYCEHQLAVNKTVVFPSFELKQALQSAFGSVLQEIACGRHIDFITLFKTVKRIFPEGGIMYQYDILATGDRILRPDLELLKKQRQEVNAAELRRVAAVPSPFLKMALQDDIRMRQQELELLMHEHSSMEKREREGRAANVLQSDRARILCGGRPVRTARRPTPSQDPYYEGPEVPQGLDFLLLLCDPMSGPVCIRNSNLKFRQFTGYGGLRNITQLDQTTELSEHTSQGAQGTDNDQESDYSEYGDSEDEPLSYTNSARMSGQSSPEGNNLDAVYTDMSSDEANVPSNEIDGLLDDLDDLIDRSPAAPLAVQVPRARRNLAVEMDKEEMDFSETLRLLQAPQSPGPERLPFKNLSNATSPQRHLPLKSPTRGRISFKLVATKPRRPVLYRPPWATSTAGASRDSPKTAGATPRDN